MKCQLAQQLIVQYIYGELTDEACRDLELHVSVCKHCLNELQAYESVRHTMSLVPAEEPSPNLLADSRVRLDNALDQLPRPSIPMRLQTSLAGLLAQLRVAPGMAAALAVVGFCLGGTAGHMWKHQNAAKVSVVSAQASTAQNPSRSTNSVQKASTADVHSSQLPDTASAPALFSVSSIVTHPDTNMVEVHFNQMIPETVEGSMDDPEV